MAKQKRIPILGRLQRGSTMKHNVANILTRLYVNQENQSQLIDPLYKASLKRAFVEVSSLNNDEIVDKVKKEISTALSFTYDKFEIDVSLEKIEDNDFRIKISGLIYNDEGESFQLNQLLKYNGSVFEELIDDQRNT